MTKKKLQEENDILKETLRKIIYETSDERIEEWRKQGEKMPYACVAGRVHAMAEITLEIELGAHYG